LSLANPSITRVVGRFQIGTHINGYAVGINSSCIIRWVYPLGFTFGLTYMSQTTQPRQSTQSSQSIQSIQSTQPITSIQSIHPNQQIKANDKTKEIKRQSKSKQRPPITGRRAQILSRLDLANPSIRMGCGTDPDRHT